MTAEWINLYDYQMEASRFAEYPDETGVVYTALGLAGEAGEIANQAKKILRDDNGELTSSRRSALVDELGDVFWYLAMLADELDVELHELATENINKLQDRKDRDAIKGDGDYR